MFDRIEHPARPDSQNGKAELPGLVIYQSALLRQAGVLHSFSTRKAGQAGQNLPDTDSQWDLATVRNVQTGQPVAGYDLLMKASGCENYPLVHVQQVHGSKVLLVDASDATANLPPPRPNTDTSAPHQAPESADGLVTAEPGVALTIRVADCVPILLAALIDGKPVAVAAVHAGWRGLVAGILPEAVRTLHVQIEQLNWVDSQHKNASNTKPQATFNNQVMRLIAAIGPCISARHFEVGHEVAAAFADANLHAAIVEIPGAKPHIDLPLAAKLQLQAAGLMEPDIDSGGLCTFDLQTDFFSHRRDHGQTGRLAAMIALVKS